MWTHGFYDGWAPNYTLLAVANLHNSIGRFYETYTSSGAGCTTVRLQAADTSRRWDRPNPPVNGLRWCIRSNINYQQSGVLIALKYTAAHRETFLEKFVAKSERMIERGRQECALRFRDSPRSTPARTRSAVRDSVRARNGGERRHGAFDLNCRAKARLVLFRLGEQASNDSVFRSHRDWSSGAIT